MHVFYLHGFASSPDSSKAIFFRDRLAGHGVRLEAPDLNAPDFATLTMTRMVAQVEEALARAASGPVVVIGSSFGGLVAWHVAARAERSRRPLSQLVLLAPAFELGSRHGWNLSDDELAAWRQTGWREVFHYAEGRPRRVHFALYEDTLAYRPDGVTVSAPGLVFQGTGDGVVDPGGVARFVKAHDNLQLRLLDDDHQLKGSLEAIWAECKAFLGLGPTTGAR